MYDTIFRLLITGMFLLPLAGVTFAQEHETSLHSEDLQHDENGHNGSGEHHDFHRNVIGVFGGVTVEERRSGSFTLGIEYERHLSRQFGIGLIAEHVFADDEFNVFAVPFAYHSGSWKSYLAPGWEKHKNHSGEFLVRVGLEYAFEFDLFEIAPQVDVDFVGGDQVLIFGVTLAMGF